MKIPRDTDASLWARPSIRRVGALVALTVAFALVGGVAHAGPLPGPVPAPAATQTVASISPMDHITAALGNPDGPPPPRLHIDSQTQTTGDRSDAPNSPDAIVAGGFPSGDPGGTATATADASTQTYTLFASRVSRTRGQPTRA